MSQEIEKTNGRGDKPKAQEGQPPNQSLNVYAPRRWPFVVTTLVLAGLAGSGGYLIWWLSAAFTDATAWATFIVGSVLNLGILLAVVSQACIYWGQRNLMVLQGNAMQSALAETREQTKTAGASLVIANKAWVGVHSIEYDRHRKIVLVRIENTGHVPAEQIRVLVEMLPGLSEDNFDGRPTMKKKGRWEFKQDYEGTKLFRGNLQITIPLFLHEYLTGLGISRTEELHTALIVRGTIWYRDGFENQPPQRSDFLFTYDAQADIWSADAPKQWAARFEAAAEYEKGGDYAD